MAWKDPIKRTKDTGVLLSIAICGGSDLHFGSKGKPAVKQSVLWIDTYLDGKVDLPREGRLRLDPNNVYLQVWLSIVIRFAWKGMIYVQCSVNILNFIPAKHAYSTPS